MGHINYFTEELSYTFPQKRLISQWINQVIRKEGHQVDEINFIFCSDRFLLALNQKHLDHDTLTDILTFPYSGPDEPFLADIYISIERVKENAEGLGVKFLDELHRVMVHGVLHLMGYSDKNAIKKAEMRKKESACLSLRKGFT